MNKYTGSNFDDFLAEEGILEECQPEPTNECWYCNWLTLWKRLRLVEADLRSGCRRVVRRWILCSTLITPRLRWSCWSAWRTLSARSSRSNWRDPTQVFLRAPHS